MRSVALALAVAALVGCGGGGDHDAGYPDAAVESFVAECREQPGATEPACRCVVGRLESSMPYEEFQRVDAAFRQERAPAEQSLAKLEQAARDCLGR